MTIYCSRRALWTSIFLTLALFCGCRGGGSSGSATATAPPATVVVSDSVIPLEMATIPMPLAGTVIGCQQTAGPSVSGLAYSNGNLSFVAPAETGQDEMLEFSFLLSDHTTVVRSVSMASLIAAVVSPAEEGGADDGAAPIVWSDLQLSLVSLSHINVLPGGFSDFRLSFVSGTNATVANLEIYLYNGIDGYEISNYFTYDPLTGIASLNPSRKADFTAKLSDSGMTMSILGTDNKGVPFGFEAYFFYGTNTIIGRIVDANGTPVTSLTGRTVALRGFTTGSTRSASIAANGTFSMTELVTDNYVLTLADCSGTASGSSMFLIPSGGSTVNVDLAVMGSAIPLPMSTVSKSTNSTVSIDRNPGLMPFQAQRSLEPRPFDPSAALDTNLPSEVNVLSVSGAGMNVTVQDEKSVPISAEAKTIVVKAVITTAEYPTFCSQPGNKYNDTWSFSWSCAGSGNQASGLVNSSHSATGTRIYEDLVDVSNQAATGNLVCKIRASTVNIGDGAYPTSVTISVEEKAGIAIRKAYHKSGLFPDREPDLGNGRFNIGVPLASGLTPGVRRPWILGVDYGPKDADIKSMKVELQYNGAKYVIGDIQDVQNESNGFVMATLTLTEGVPLTPAGNQLANILVTLTGEVKGVSYTSQPKAMLFSNKQDSVQPLFEINSLYTIPASRRFGERNLAEGSDGWGRVDMLTWLTSASWNTLPFNDISGEHAWQNAKGRSLGAHVSHKGGYDVDARYFDENGLYVSSLQGDNNGASIKQTIDLAEEEFKNGEPSQPNLLKLIKWIKTNRTKLSVMANDSAVIKLIVGVGTQLEDDSVIPWHRNALLDGLFPDGQEIPDITLPQVDGDYPFLGKWNQRSGKICPLLLHEGHIHVRLKP
jgi:hypothetical protein